MNTEHAATLSSLRSAEGGIPVAVRFYQDSLIASYPAALKGPRSREDIYEIALLHSLSTKKVVGGATGHREPVQALAFSPGDQSLLLCSASLNSTFLWGVDDVFKGEVVIAYH